MSNEIMSNSAVMETENGNQIRRIPIRSNSNLVSSGFAVRTPLWAGLGTCVDNAPTIEDAISMAGLNWIAEERPLYHRANEVFDVDKKISIAACSIGVVIASLIMWFISFGILGKIF